MKVYQQWIDGKRSEIGRCSYAETELNSDGDTILVLTGWMTPQPINSGAPINTSNEHLVKTLAALIERLGGAVVLDAIEMNKTYGDVVATQMDAPFSVELRINDKR